MAIYTDRIADITIQQMHERLSDLDSWAPTNYKPRDNYRIPDPTPPLPAWKYNVPAAIFILLCGGLVFCVIDLIRMYVL